MLACSLSNPEQYAWRCVKFEAASSGSCCTALSAARKPERTAPGGHHSPSRVISSFRCPYHTERYATRHWGCRPAWLKRYDLQGPALRRSDAIGVRLCFFRSHAWGRCGAHPSASLGKDAEALDPTYDHALRALAEENVLRKTSFFALAPVSLPQKTV